ncbi:heparan-alpha-glucosaminide N-acetyltransferase domain-containing protein [Archangium lansingense]|uniref:Heparan-alpha-glucosaminide N-acetyltransferase domain-containing protein n=1 Tax=Archangium lansingense TaxID=2995310 RepID=A0ABT4AC89_9BACT|nr:heparan-alpha-glucosaminide N-acetyltransferase domain-containing protein [Archangium lansinium]MCY1078519.1 heparan-alpha-glucosaminide N-acetyltransferase domain-containing protein [Archangium lansinium]
MSSAPTSERVRAIDWLRGIAVLFMIQCHALVLLTPELRQSKTTKFLLMIDGLVAPAFLFAAGFALALLLVRSASVGGQLDRLGRNLRRTLQVLGVATLVNWMWFPLFREPKWLVRLDILHCVGLSLLIVLPVAAWLASRPRVLRGVALALALVTFFLSPLGEAAQGPWAYVLNKSTGAVFPLLPWLGFTWFGAYAGAVAGEQGRAGLIRALLFLSGLGLAGWLAADPLRDMYPEHRFFVTNPSNAAERWMWVSLLLLGLMGLERRMTPKAAPSRVRRFVETFGTASMSAYFFHEALLYFHIFGFSFEKVWGGRSGWGQYTLLTVALIALTYGLCLALDAAQNAVRRAGRFLVETLPGSFAQKIARSE